MTLETDLRTHILASSGLSALIGTRLYPDRLPQNATLPAVVYQEVSSVPVDHVHGAAGRLVRSRYQFTVWAATRASAKTIDEAIRARIDGTGRSTIGTTAIHAILRQERVSGWDFDADDDHVATDYYIWYREA
jgi:hypothetical protein